MGGRTRQSGVVSTTGQMGMPASQWLDGYRARQDTLSSFPLRRSPVTRESLLYPQLEYSLFLSVQKWKRWNVTDLCVLTLEGLESTIVESLYSRYGLNIRKKYVVRFSRGISYLFLLRIVQTVSGGHQAF